MGEPASSKPLRRFAPLDPAAAASAPSDLPKLAGIVFDVDGTLCEPQNYMFKEMRDALSIPPEDDILNNIWARPTAEQPSAWKTLEEIEQRAMREQKPQPGLVQLMDYLERRGVRRALCTRNFDQPVTHLLTTFLPTHQAAFSPIITRTFTPPKPHPAGILEVARQWGEADAARLVMVGDSMDDMRAGRAAGAVTVLLRQAHNADTVAGAPETDVAVGRLDELVGVLERGLVVGEGEE